LRNSDTSFLLLLAAKAAFPFQSNLLAIISFILIINVILVYAREYSLDKEQTSYTDSLVASRLA